MTVPPLDGRMQPGQIAHRKQGGGARLLIICGALSVVLFALSVQGQGMVVGLRAGFSTAISPLRNLGALISAPFQGFGNAVANLTADQDTLSELREANELLAARNVELEESEQAAKRLQALLDLQSAYNLQSTGARVIANSTDSWEASVTIDKGSLAGFDVGMPVLDSSGVVGQIVRADPATSVVRLLTSENSGISAMVQQSRAQGMLNGSASGALHLDMVRTDQAVNVGDTVITSGLGGVYPKGLPLGKVTSVSRNTALLYLDIVVLPFATLDANEEVLVVTSLTEEQEATAEELAEADRQDEAANLSTGEPDVPSSPDLPDETQFVEGGGSL